MKSERPLTPGRLIVGGCPEGYDARVLADTLARAGGPVLHVARDDARLAAMRAALGFFAPEVPVLTFPAWDCLPYDRISPNPEIAAARMATLAALADGFGRPAVVLTTINAATQRIPARAVLREASFTAQVGQRIDMAALRGYLARMGFQQAPTVTEPGEFAIRGGLIDIYPPGMGGPVRLDLFGDVLDSARRFDPESQRTTEKVSRLELAPVSEVILDEAAIGRFRTRYRAEFGAAGNDDPLYEAVSAGRKHQGYEHWLPYFHERLETVLDYVPDAPVLLDEGLDALRAARWESLTDQYEARSAALSAKSKLGTVYKPAAPELLYLDDAAWSAALDGRIVRQMVALPQPPGPTSIDAGGRIGRDFAPERQQETVSLFGALAAHVAERRRAGNVVLASYSKGALERMAGLLEDDGVTGAKEAARASDVPEGKGGLYLTVWGLEHGFEAPGLTVISEQDVLGDRLIRAPRRRKRAENFLTEAAGLTPGDLVVHVDHGIGRYRGLETITAMGAPHECIHLEYSGGDKLYLPVENIELLSRYGHEEGLLDRLGGGAWQAKKAKLKARIRDMADRLIRIAAERALRKGQVLTPPEHHVWEEFCARFPYAETDDQLNAISDVLGDMESGPADGPSGLRRRRVRQDRGGAARGVRRGDERDAGGGDRAHDAAGAAAFQELLRAVPGPAAAGADAVAVRQREGRRRHAGGSRGRHGRDRDRDARASGEDREVQGPRPAGHRRGAAFRRAAQGAAQGAAFGHPRADADRDADPAHASDGAVGRARAEPDRDAARRPAGDPDLCQRVRSGHGARGASARALPGRAVVLRRAAHFGHRGYRAVPARAGAGGQLRDRARPDGGGRARRPDERVLRRQIRRAAGDDDHRERARHSGRQHADRRPRGHVRAVAALPDPGPGRAARNCAPTRSSPPSRARS